MFLDEDSAVELRHKKPGLAKADPERASDDELVGEWFHNWCKANGVSVRDLMRILRLKSTATALAKRSGNRALTLVDIKRFPSRYRHELTSRFLSWCDSPSSSSNSISAHG